MQDRYRLNPMVVLRDGPRGVIPPELRTRQRVAQILARVDRQVEGRTPYRQQRALARWAAEDDGPIPTPDGTRAEIRHEYEVLLAGLGWLAVLEPEDLDMIEPENFPDHFRRTHGREQ